MPGYLIGLPGRVIRNVWRRGLIMVIILRPQTRMVAMCVTGMLHMALAIRIPSPITCCVRFDYCIMHGCF